MRFPLILRTEVRCMVCCWRVFGLAAAAFGLGLLLAQLLPACLLLPIATVLLIAAGIVVHWND